MSYKKAYDQIQAAGKDYFFKGGDFKALDASRACRLARTKEDLEFIRAKYGENYHINQAILLIGNEA